MPAEIAVKVKLDSKEAERGAAALGDKVGAAGGKLTRGLTLPILGAGAALVAMGKKAGDNADRLFDMAAQTGLSTDKLQEMEYVATQVGVSTDFYKKAVEAVIKDHDQLAKGTGPASEAFEALGISVRDANGEMKSGEQITDEAMKALEGIEDPTKRAALAQDIFKRANQDMLVAIGAGTDAVDAQRKAAHELGVVQSTDALEGADKFRAGMDSLTAQLGGVVGMLGGELAPLLSDVVMPLVQDHIVPAVRTFAEFIGKLAERFNNLSPRMKGFIGGLIGAAAVAGPVLLAAGKLIKIFGAVGQAFKVLTLIMAANPWLLLIAAIVALVTIVVMNWDTITEYLGKAWQWIKDAAAAVGDFLKEVFRKAIDFLVNLFLNFTGPGLIIKHFDKIKDAATGAYDWIKSKFQALVDFLVGLFKWSPVGLFLTHLGDLKEAATTAKNWVVDRFDDLVGFITGLPGRISTAASGLFNGIKEAFRGAANWIIDKWNGLELTIGGARISIPFGPTFDIPSITLGTPNIPRFHSGGTFRAPPGQTEGLAILRNNERVLTPEQGGAVNVYVTVQGSVTSERDLVDTIRKGLLDIKRRNGSVGLA